MHTLVSGHRIGYEVDGTGPVLALLHAFPLNRAMWRPQVAALRDRFTVVTPDFRGFGESEPPAGPLDMDDYARDVIGLLEALGHDRFALAGCSMGGYVAFRMMPQAAGRVTSLILADTRAEPDTEEGRTRRLASITRIEREGPRPFLDEMTLAVVGPTTKAARPGVAAAVRQIINDPPPAALTAALHAMAARPDSQPLLATLRIPTLVVVGEEDSLTPPASSEAMVQMLPQARLVRMPGAGHLSNLEAPEAFNRAVREFLLAQQAG